MGDPRTIKGPFWSDFLRQPGVEVIHPRNLLHVEEVEVRLSHGGMVRIRVELEADTSPNDIAWADDLVMRLRAYGRNGGGKPHAAIPGNDVQ